MQNLAREMFSVWQLGQIISGNLFPQEMQCVASSGLVSPHSGQIAEVPLSSGGGTGGVTT